MLKFCWKIQDRKLYQEHLDPGFIFIFGGAVQRPWLDYLPLVTLGIDKCLHSLSASVCNLLCAFAIDSKLVHYMIYLMVLSIRHRIWVPTIKPAKLTAFYATVCIRQSVWVQRHFSGQLINKWPLKSPENSQSLNWIKCSSNGNVPIKLITSTSHGWTDYCDTCPAGSFNTTP